jgi:hypothetical protein
VGIYKLDSADRFYCQHTSRLTKSLLQFRPGTFPHKAGGPYSERTLYFIDIMRILDILLEVMKIISNWHTTCSLVRLFMEKFFKR